MTARPKRPELSTKRVYEPASEEDGKRILIDRLWPRGLSREKARIDYWAKEAAPSDALRKWYRHDPEKWEHCRDRYVAELDARPEAVEALRAELVPGRNSILFGSRERDLNNARALVEYLAAR